MHDKAISIRNNPGKYNLWNHNCGQVAQIILKAGNKDFAATKFDWWNTRPNSVYSNIVNEIDKGEREGWQYGLIDELDSYYKADITTRILSAVLNQVKKITEECLE